MRLVDICIEKWNEAALQPKTGQAKREATNVLHVILLWVLAGIGTLGRDSELLRIWWVENLKVGKAFNDQGDLRKFQFERKAVPTPAKMVPISSERQGPVTFLDILSLGIGKKWDKERIQFIPQWR